MSSELRLPDNLQAIVNEFEWCEGQEKIELLLQYSDSLTPLPERHKENHEEMEQVHECMTPVFVEAEKIDGALYYYFDIPKESPTVRGFASILQKGLNGSKPESIIRIPNDFYLNLGLESVLSHQRLHGFAGILVHLKRLAAEILAG